MEALDKPVHTMVATNPCIPSTKAATENHLPKPALKEFLEHGRTIDMCSSMEKFNPSSA